MKPALRWLQNNPILITAVILCIAALVMLMVVHFQGRVFNEQTCGLTIGIEFNAARFNGRISIDSRGFHR